jgi:tetratricopeptide (TPR) repeat protein
MKIFSQLSLLVVISLAFLLISASAQAQPCADRDFECKITESTKRIAANPNDTEAYYDLGSAYNRVGKNDEAIANINKYIALKPEKPEFLADGYFVRGNAYRDKGSPDQAIADYNMAISLNPGLTNAYINRGLVYYAKNDYTTAISDFTQAIRVNPEEPESYYNRGLVFEKKADYPKAIADYDKYISMNTAETENLADGYHRRGSVYLNMGSLTQALNDFTMAIQLMPEKSSFYTSRAKVYRKQGNIALAQADEQKAATLKQ